MKTHQAFLPAVVLLAGMLVTGCQSTSSSIVRVATLSKPLSATCVTNAILAVPGITQVMPIAVSPAPIYSVYRLYEQKVPYVNFLYLGANGTRGIVTVKPQSRVPMVEDGVPALQLSRTWTDHNLLLVKSIPPVKPWMTFMPASGANAAIYLHRNQSRKILLT